MTDHHPGLGPDESAAPSTPAQRAAIHRNAAVDLEQMSGIPGYEDSGPRAITHALLAIDARLAQIAQLLTELVRKS